MHAYLRTFGLHEFAHLKFTVYGCGQTDIHTTSANAVTLVWRSLKLAPIKKLMLYNANTHLSQIILLLNWSCNELVVMYAGLREELW